ncbi:hypothetical protein QOZ96_003320 [Brevundimonas nasdae]|uniref:Uncharacterized protein n=1 Tax=Brevundimonas nasdae TaxID=172043 RepID=A0ABX8TMY3_9CAUL|nr:hypothetical protein [Brevundimonas nasdae]MBK6026842.1 hypothetical protein [Brevundimonas nasdae]MDQ0453350.1 hypothetical protein [Brevundimonas nasdae]QYC12424.1 hypothetical protein KWG56_18445 [Brevundimonas nasdae]
MAQASMNYDEKLRLFGCCTDLAPPDWSDFTHLFLSAVCETDEGCTSGQTLANAQFFSVYGVNLYGEVEVITDTPDGATLTEAWDLANDLGSISGLRVDLCSVLQGALA